MKPSVYIFRGAPASGKGTIVPEFAKRLPKPVAVIEQDKLRWGLHLIGRDIQDVLEEEHHFAFHNTVLLFEEYVKTNKYNIVVEGLFTWDNAEASQGNCKQLIDIAKSHGLACHSTVLKADKQELLRRNAERPYSVPAEEFELLYENIYSKIDDTEVVIDSTHKSVDKTQDDLTQILQV